MYENIISFIFNMIQPYLETFVARIVVGPLEVEEFETHVYNISRRFTTNMCIFFASVGKNLKFYWL